MTLFCNMPTRREKFLVAARSLTDADLLIIVGEIWDEASVFYDLAENRGGPRSWPSIEAFLGFQIAKAAHVYRPTPAQLQTIVAMTYEKTSKPKETQLPKTKRIEIEPGTRIAAAVVDMIAIAQRENCECTATFNDVALRVNADSNANEIVDSYMNRNAENAERKRHPFLDSVSQISPGYYWALMSWTWHPCHVVRCGDMKIHGKVPAENKVVTWMGDEACDSLEELIAEGWLFRPLIPPTDRLAPKPAKALLPNP